MEIKRKPEELDSIVPPRELCAQIPRDCFRNSALVWWGACVYPRLYPDGVCYGQPWHKRSTIPAPTLAQIVAELTPGEDGCGVLSQFGKDKNGWFMMFSFEGADDDYGTGLDIYETKDKNNAAKAALELWLALRKEIK